MTKFEGLKAQTSAIKQLTKSAISTIDSRVRTHGKQSFTSSLGIRNSLENIARITGISINKLILGRNINDLSADELLNILEALLQIAPDEINKIKSDDKVAEVINEIMGLQYAMVAKIEDERIKYLHDIEASCDEIDKAVEADKSNAQVMISDQLKMIDQNTRASGNLASIETFEDKVDNLAELSSAANVTRKAIVEDNPKLKNKKDENYRETAKSTLQNLGSSLSSFKTKRDKNTKLDTPVITTEEKKQVLVKESDLIGLSSKSLVTEYENISHEIDRLDTDLAKNDRELKTTFTPHRVRIEKELKELEPKRGFFRNLFFGTRKKYRELEDDLKKATTQEQQKIEEIKELNDQLEELDNQLSRNVNLQTALLSLDENKLTIDKKVAAQTSVANFDKMLSEVEKNRKAMLANPALNREFTQRQIAQTERKQRAGEFEENFVRGFNRELNRAILVAQGIVTDDRTDLDTIILKGAGAALGLVPVAGQALSLLMSGAQFALGYYKAKQSEILENKAEGMSEVIKLIASHLAISYGYALPGSKSPLDNLPPEAVNKLATLAVEKIIDVLMDKDLETNFPLLANMNILDVDPQIIADQLIAVLHSENKPENFVGKALETKKKLGLKIREHHNFDLKAKDGQKWTAEGFLERCGIVVEGTDEKFVHPKYADRINKYGFRLVTKEEAENLLKSGFVPFKESKESKKEVQDKESLLKEIDQGKENIEFLIGNYSGNRKNLASEKLKKVAVGKVLNLATKIGPLTDKELKKELKDTFGEEEISKQILETLKQIGKKWTKLFNLYQEDALELASNWAKEYSSKLSDVKQDSDIRRRALLETAQNRTDYLESLVRSHIQNYLLPKSKNSPQNVDNMLWEKMPVLFDMMERYAAGIPKGTADDGALKAELVELFTKKGKSSKLLSTQDAEHRSFMAILDEVKTLSRNLARTKEGGTLSVAEKKAERKEFEPSEEFEEPKKEIDSKKIDRLSLKYEALTTSMDANLDYMYELASTKNNKKEDHINKKVKESVKAQLANKVKQSEKNKVTPEELDKLIENTTKMKLLVLAEEHCDSAKKDKDEILKKGLAEVLTKGRTGKRFGKQDEHNMAFNHILEEAKNLSRNLSNAKGKLQEIAREEAKSDRPEQPLDYIEFLDRLHEKYQDKSSINFVSKKGGISLKAGVAGELGLAATALALVASGEQTSAAVVATAGVTAAAMYAYNNFKSKTNSTENETKSEDKKESESFEQKELRRRSISKNDNDRQP